jgi:hypothetical protein
LPLRSCYQHSCVCTSACKPLNIRARRRRRRNSRACPCECVFSPQVCVPQRIRAPNFMALQRHRRNSRATYNFVACQRQRRNGRSCPCERVFIPQVCALQCICVSKFHGASEALQGYILKFRSVSKTMTRWRVLPLRTCVRWSCVFSGHTHL